MLQTKMVNPGEAEYERITALLPAIFPPEELAPPSVSNQPLPYRCFYDDGEFIGFAEVLKETELHYLKYIAVLPPFRSRGYGGRMLDLILQERGTLPLALDIEPVDEQAPNYEQRAGRLRFYLRHGMTDTGYVLVFKGHPYTILSTGEAAVPEIMRRYAAEHPQENGIAVVPWASMRSAGK